MDRMEVPIGQIYRRRCVRVSVEETELAGLFRDPVNLEK